MTHTLFHALVLRCVVIAAACLPALGCTLAWAQPAAAPPKYGPHAVRLVDARDHVIRQPAPDFWALISYYSAQQDERSCSVASSAMLLNALRSGRQLSAAEPLITQPELLRRVGVDAWKTAVAPGGEGVSLDELGSNLERALAAYQLEGAKVEVVHVADTSAETRSRLRAMLTQNEQSASDLVLANFLQSVYTGDPEGAVGHIAPVGAYDAVRRRVLILDPDRQWYEPYWVPEDVFLQGLATRDETSGKPRGYVRVLLKEGK